MFSVDNLRRIVCTDSIYKNEMLDFTQVEIYVSKHLPWLTLI